MGINKMRNFRHKVEDRRYMIEDIWVNICV